MGFIAIEMLYGYTAKYMGLIFGVTVATLLRTQQVSIAKQTAHDLAQKRKKQFKNVRFIPYIR